MRSFAIIVAALSFGALSWAAPVPEANPLGMVEFGQRDIIIPRTPEVEARDVFVPEKRGETPDTLQMILMEVIEELTPYCQILTSCTKEKATLEYLTEPCKAIIACLLAAVTRILKLVGCSAEQILGKREGGLLDCNALAKLLADICLLVLGAVGTLIKLLGFLKIGALFELLCAILDALAKLIECVFQLVAGIIEGLLRELLTLIASVVWVVLFCGVPSLMKVLCL